MTFTVLKHAAAVVAGALIVLPVGISSAETFNRTLGNGPEAPAIVPGTASSAPPARRSPPVQISRGKAAPAPAAISEPTPNAAEVVGRLLAPGASNPDVPLPHPDLAEKSEAPAPLTGPTLYGRQEPGGGVLGFRLPIPAERGGSPANTRYSSGSPSSDGVVRTPLQSR